MKIFHSNLKVLFFLPIVIFLNCSDGVLTTEESASSQNAKISDAETSVDLTAALKGLNADFTWKNESNIDHFELGLCSLDGCDSECNLHITEETSARVSAPEYGTYLFCLRSFIPLESSKNNDVIQFSRSEWFEQEINFIENKQESQIIETVTTEIVTIEKVIIEAAQEDSGEEPDALISYSITANMTEFKIPLLINKDQPLRITTTVSPATSLLMTSSDTSILTISNDGVIRTLKSGTGTVTITPELGLGSATISFEVFVYPEFEERYFLGQFGSPGNSAGTPPAEAASDFIYPAYASFTSDDKYLVASDSNLHRVQIFDMETMNFEIGMEATFSLGAKDEVGIAVPTDHSSGFYTPSCARTSPDGKWLAVADNGNRRVQIFDISAGFSSDIQAAHTLGVSGQIGNEDDSSDDNTHLTSVRSIEFTPDSKFLAVVDDTENVVKIFNIENGFTDETLMEATYIIGTMYTKGISIEAGDNLLDEPYTVAFTPDGNSMAISQKGSSNIVEIFDISDGFSSEMVSSYVIGGSGSAAFDGLYSATFSPDGRYMLTSEKEFLVQLFNISEGFSEDLSAVQTFGTGTYGDGSEAYKFSWLRGAIFSNKGDRLAITDMFNSRIVVYQAPQP